MDLKDRVITGALRIVDIPKDFMECMQHNEKLKTVERISGTRVQCCQWGNKYSYEREVRAAKMTDWRLLFPAAKGSPDGELFERVMAAVEALPVDGMDDTQLSSKRRLVVQEQVRQATHSVPPPKRAIKVLVQPTPTVRDPMKLTRSAWLLKEARLAQISEEAKRESNFLFSGRYESYLRGEKGEAQSHNRHGRPSGAQMQMNEASIE
jgi:hypothetical protein